MKKITTNLTAIFAFVLAFALMFMNTINASASQTTTDIYVHEGSRTVGDANEGAHLYVLSDMNRRYYKVSMKVELPRSREIDLAGETRAAYISLGVKGNGAVDFGLKNTGDGWYPYRYDISRGEPGWWDDKDVTYSGTVDMSLETYVSSSGRAVLCLRIDNDFFEYVPTKSSTFVEWHELIDNQFYRFVSLVNKEGVDDDHNDGSKLLDVDISDILIHKVYTDEDGYPEAKKPRELAWGIDASTVDEAWEVYPNYIDVDTGTYSELVEIRHY